MRLPPEYVASPAVIVPVKDVIPRARWPKLKRLRSAKITKVDYDKGAIVVSVQIDGDEESR